ncbi:MAG: TlpA family protein disulfide reductase [Flavobacteriaceae bacterium]|nr:TlpA family protein disulfide reductase [Flavobacteriaceae bacterium]
MKSLFITLAALSISFGSFAQTKQLPDLKLKDLNGNERNIKDLGTTGKITIITMWATWCKPCVQEINAINEVMEEWKTKYGVVLVAVSVDNARNTPKVKPFVDGQGWDFDVILDVNEDLKRALNAPSVPYLILVDEKGKIVYEHNGYLPGDEVNLEEKIKKLKGL